MNWDNIITEDNLIYSSTVDNKKLKASVVDQEYCSIKFFETFPINEYEEVLLSLLLLNICLSEEALFHKLGCNAEDKGELQIMHRLLKGAASWGLVECSENHIVKPTLLGKFCLSTGKKYKFYNGKASLYRHLSIVDNGNESLWFDFPNEIGLISNVTKGTEIPYCEIDPEFVFSEEAEDLVKRLRLQSAHRYNIFDATESEYWLPETVQVSFRLFNKDGRDYLTVFNGDKFSEKATELLYSTQNRLFREGKIEWCRYECLLNDESAVIDYRALAPFADLLDTTEVARILSSGRVDWEDQALFDIIASISNADNWSIISQKAQSGTILSNLDKYQDRWDWLSVSQRLPVSSIINSVGSYPWLYEAVSKRDDILPEELEALLLNPKLKYQEWDWEAILPSIRSEFIEEHIAEIEFDLFEITEKVMQEKPQLIFDNPDRHWDWILLSNKLPLDLLATEYARIFNYVNIRITLSRLLSSTPEIAHDVVSSSEILQCFKDVNPAKIGFTLNQEALLWNTEIVSFLETFGIISWHSEHYPGLEENPGLLWDEGFFSAFNSRIDSEDGYRLVSSRVTSTSIVRNHPEFNWDWVALSTNSAVLTDASFLKDNLWSLDRTKIFSGAEKDVLEKLASDSSIIERLDKSEMDVLSRFIPIPFIRQHTKAPYFWNWSALTERVFEHIDRARIGEDFWIDKWDWDYLSQNLEWDFIEDNLSKFASKWNWETIISRIPKEQIVDADFIERLADAIWILSSDRTKRLWSNITSQYERADLERLIHETSDNRKVQWDYSYLYNAKGFNVTKYLERPELIRDWGAFSASEAAAKFFAYDERIISRKKWRERVKSDLGKTSYRWDFKGLSRINALIDDVPILNDFQTKWDWSLICKESRIFNGDAAEKSIRKFEEMLDYATLSEREGMVVNPELLISLSYKPWNWAAISGNKSFRLKSIDTLDSLEDRKWDWKVLSSRTDIDFSNFGSSGVIDEDWDWDALSNRNDIVFDDEAISHLYVFPFDWFKVSQKRSFHPTAHTLSLLKIKPLDWDAISGNENLERSAIWDYRNRFTWTKLTRNKALDLTNDDILYQYEDYLDWTYASQHLDAFFFTQENLRHFRSKLVWPEIMTRITSFTPELLDEFKDVIDWTYVSKDEQIRFTSDLIKQFKPYWDWAELTRNRAANLAMSREDSEFSHEWNVATFVRRFYDESHLRKPCIYHFSHLFNAVDIIKRRQILSRDKIRQVDGGFADAAGSVVSRSDKAHPYARFYFRPKTPTQFYNEFLGMDSSLYIRGKSYYSRALNMGLPKCPIPVFFEFDLQEVLTKMPDKCFYSTGNLQADASRIIKVQDDPSRLNIDNLYLESSWRNFDLYKQYSQQEFLVKGEFNFDNLNSFRIICPDGSYAKLLATMLGDDPVISRIVVDRSLYNFNNRELSLKEDRYSVSISTDYSDMSYFRVSSSRVDNLSIMNPGDIIKEGNGFVNMRRRVEIEKKGTPFIVEFVDPLARNKNWIVYSDGDVMVTEQADFSSIKSLLTSFPLVMRSLPLALDKRLFYPEMVDSYHGIAHTSRVLLYSYLICCRSTELSDEEKGACYLAAIIHDLGKTNDREGSIHGYNSMLRYKDTVNGLVPNSTLQGRILNAVRYHSISDEECPDAIRRDIIWKVLKDSDALDRSRFSSGCDVRYLRLPLFQQPFGEKLIDFASRLPAITAGLSWNDPYNELIEVINRTI